MILLFIYCPNRYSLNPLTYILFWLIFFSNKFKISLVLQMLIINAPWYLNISNLLLLLIMVSANPEEVTFVYQGVEYDATEYSTKHPGGPEFIENMKKERKDFTEYFKYVFFKTQMSSFRTGRESPQVFPRCFKRTTIQKLNWIRQDVWKGSSSFRATLGLRSRTDNHIVLHNDDRMHDWKRNCQHFAFRFHSGGFRLGRPLNGPQPPSMVHEIRQNRSRRDRRIQSWMVEPQAQHASHLH